MLRRLSSSGSGLGNWSRTLPPARQFPPRSLRQDSVRPNLICRAQIYCQRQLHEFPAEPRAQYQRTSQMKKMAMLLLCCVCAGAECALGAATRFGPDITLYASFDSRPDEVLDSDASFPRPARGLSYVLWSGATGIYPAVDFSLNGMPLIHQCGLVPAVDGRRGQAVRLGNLENGGRARWPWTRSATFSPIRARSVSGCVS